MIGAEALARTGPAMPEAEAAHLRAAYAEADAILEYGAGGSTMLAARMPGKRVWSVESDADWAATLRDRLDADPPAEGTEIEATVPLSHLLTPQGPSPRAAETRKATA